MSIKRNVLANYAGQGWTAFVGIIFTPLYVHYLGIEAYALVGVFAILQSWANLLDMGLTPTLNREMALFKAGSHTAESIRDLLRSLEYIYAGIAAVVAFAIWLSSSWLAHAWLNVQHMPVATVSNAIATMGFVIAARWWEQVYRGAVQGMGEQVWLNAAQAIIATVRWGGAALALIFIAPSIRVFFVWQAFISLIAVAVLAWRTYSWLPPSRSGRFTLNAIKPIWNFAAHMAGTSLLTLLLTQVDKILLSKLLSLTVFGYYTLAGTIAGGLHQLVAPMNYAVYPKLTADVARDDKSSLIQTYFQASEWVAFLLVPPAFLLAAYPEAILWLWTANPALAASVAPTMRLLVLGTMINGLLNAPFLLQLAYGWAQLSFRANLVAVACFVPAILLIVPRYGVVGAASIWLVLNSAYLIIGLHFMHIRILADEKFRWYARTVVAPLLAGGVVVLAARLLAPVPTNRIALIATLAAVMLVTAAAVAVSMAATRNQLLHYFRLKTA